MEQLNEKKFSLIKRAESFTHAGRGIWICVKTTHNIWVQFFVFVCVAGLGFSYKISSIEWIMIILASGMVFVAETFNTAIEIDMNLTSPEFHPYARDTKDVAAGAVLVSAIIAFIVGLIIFLPKIF